MCVCSYLTPRMPKRSRRKHTRSCMRATFACEREDQKLLGSRLPVICAPAFRSLFIRSVSAALLVLRHRLCYNLVVEPSRSCPLYLTISDRRR